MNCDEKYQAELDDCKSKLDRLKKENEGLLADLHEVNQKLLDSEQLKSHFISNVSNEIVNPFASIIALSQGIKLLEEGEIQKSHHMAGLIFDEAFHLDFQLKNIFTAALIEAGKEEIRSARVDLESMQNQINQYFKPLLEKKQIRLLQNTDDREMLFTTDREKLELMTKNLISNSIKYSPPEATIEVVYTLVDSFLRIEVSDHGKGIHPEDRKVIFDRFRQLDEKINSINTGHGLGLSIVKAYADMLGGSVDLFDNENSGITVCITIPESLASEKWTDLEGFIFDSEASY